MDGNYSLSDIAAVSSNRNNDGMFGGDWGAWIILFLIFGLFGNGRGFGGGNWGSCGSPCATQADVRAAVDQQTLISKIDQQTYGLSSTFTALNDNLNSNFRGIDNAICTLGYQNQQGFNNLGHQISDCCCTTQRLVEKGFCDLGNAMNLNTRDILESNNANTRAILDFLTQDKIATLTAENQNLKLAASQSNQNAVLMAAMDANKAEILRRTGAECPTPAYIVQPPQPVTFPTNCCGQFSGYNNGCGCGSF